MYTVRAMASYPTLGEALASPDVPRVIMVRSPYSRVLSAYMEKLEIRKEGSFAPKGYVRQETIHSIAPVHQLWCAQGKDTDGRGALCSDALMYYN